MRLPPFALAIFLISSNYSYALEALEDASLSDITGEGIAYLPENIKIVFDDTAYVRTLPSSTAPAFGEKAELVWYGLAFAGNDGNVSDRVGNPIVSWGTANNPWILKAETLTKRKYSGAVEPFPVLSYYAPTYTLNDGELKYGFWADLVIRNKTTDVFIDRFQSQSVWNGVSLNGSRMSIFQSTVDYNTSAHNTVSATNSGSLGIAWLNRINSSDTGIFRFSVAQTTPSTPTTDTVSTDAPVFNTQEGMYARDFDMNMVVGTMHYQPLIVGSAGDGSQNFQIELVRLPNNPAIYNEHYRDYDDASQAYKMCTSTTVDCSRATHSEMSIANVSFKNPAGVTVNLGSAIYEGMMIHHLKLKTLGL